MTTAAGVVVGAGVVELLVVGAGVVELLVVGAGVVVTKAHGPPGGPSKPATHVQLNTDTASAGEVELAGQRLHVPGRLVEGW